MCEHNNNNRQSGTGLRAALKAKFQKVTKKIGDCLAKHHLLGQHRYDSWHLEELGRKYWTCPSGVDEETYRNSVRGPGSTWWHNCDKPDDSCKVAMAKYPRLDREPTIYRDYKEPADAYYRRSKKEQNAPMTELSPGNQFMGGTSVVTKLGADAKEKSEPVRPVKELAVGSKLMGSKAVVPAEFTKKEGKRPMKTLPPSALKVRSATATIKEKKPPVKSVRFSRPITKPGECSRDPWGWRKTESDA